MRNVTPRCRIVQAISDDLEARGLVANRSHVEECHSDKPLGVFLLPGSLNGDARRP